MNNISLHLPTGTILEISISNTETQILRVVERTGNGYLLRPDDGGETITWRENEIHDKYVAKQLRIIATNAPKLPAKLIDSFKEPWDAWPEADRRTAVRRRMYVRKVEEIKDSFPSHKAAFEAAADAVYAENRERWDQEDRVAFGRMTAEKSHGRNRAAQRETKFKGSQKPSPSTVRLWVGTWKSQGESIASLRPGTHRSGRRGPRAPNSTDGSPETYKLMWSIIDKDRILGKASSKKRAYKSFCGACKERQLPDLSYRTFCIHSLKRSTAREELKAKGGALEARAEFGVFKKTKAVSRLLQEVEVDHCLLKCVACHPVTGKVLGRPWVTVFIDRASRAILGSYISFEPPSYACLQRALVHAMWPKNLSGIAGIKNDWPCYGIPEEIYSDNGKEMLSEAFATTAALLDFLPIALPARSPWLKGMIERFFRTMGCQVFDMNEGLKFLKDEDTDLSGHTADFTLTELNEMVVKWVVDVYHQTEHSALKCTPMERWNQLMAVRPPRPVPSYHDIIHLTGDVHYCTIQKYGILIDGLTYCDKKVLERLRARRGSEGKKWLARIDPYNLGELFLFDDIERKWFTISCEIPEISRGTSKYQHDTHIRIAKQNVPEGVEITTDDLAHAKTIAESEVKHALTNKTSWSETRHAARYETRGELFTPVLGDPRPAAIARRG